MNWLFSHTVGVVDVVALGLAFVIAMLIIFQQRKELNRQHKQLLAHIDREGALMLWIFSHASRLRMPMDTGILLEVRKQAEKWKAHEIAEQQERKKKNGIH